MAAKVMTINKCTHELLDAFGYGARAFIVPPGAKYVYMWPDDDIAFEVQIGGSDPDGGSLDADEYFQWPALKHGTMALDAWTRTKAADVDTTVYFVVSGFANLEIAFLSEGI